MPDRLEMSVRREGPYGEVAGGQKCCPPRAYTPDEGAFPAPADAREGPAQSYFRRKAAEMTLLDACLETPLALPPAADGAAVIDGKFRLAAALRAERSLQSWAITETARPEVEEWTWGAYRFAYGYQRADLDVRGPPVYEALVEQAALRFETLYTASGMSAIAAVVTGLLREHRRATVFAAAGGYSETRELLQSLGERVTLAPMRSRARRGRLAAPGSASARLLWVDSAAAGGLGDFASWTAGDVDLAVFDTTCYGATSSRLERVVRWASSAGVPLVLVRSHAKLDSLGIEYGRLGSVVLAWDGAGPAHETMKALLRAIAESIRLYGTAALPSHFPPFTGTAEYRRLSIARTAALIRATRRLARTLAARLGSGDAIRPFPHGLYFTLAPGGALRLKDVKHAAASLCNDLAAQGLPVKHAGSFGFDFVSVEWFFDVRRRRNVLRVAGGDVPPDQIDAIAGAIARWWAAHRISRPMPDSIDTVAAVRMP